MSITNRATQEALKAVNAAVRGGIDRQRFAIDRFGRHPDGYLHARIIVDGRTPVYLHCRFGSWLVPGTFNGRTGLKEPEALLGTDLGRSVKYALSDQAQRFHPTPPPPEEAVNDDAAEVDDDAGGDDSPGPVAGVPEG